jgi:hypothetical protein
LEDHLNQVVGSDERRNIQLNADVLIGPVDGGNGGAGIADRAKGNPAGQENALTDDDLRQLSIAREDGRTRKYFRLAGLRDGVQRRLKIRADNLVETAARTGARR